MASWERGSQTTNHDHQMASVFLSHYTAQHTVYLLNNEKLKQKKLAIACLSQEKLLFFLHILHVVHPQISEKSLLSQWESQGPCRMWNDGNHQKLNQEFGDGLKVIFRHNELLIVLILCRARATRRYWAHSHYSIIHWRQWAFNELSILNGIYIEKDITSCIINSFVGPIAGSATGL